LHTGSASLISILSYRNNTIFAYTLNIAAITL
jgi:hypothetical protein